MVLDGVVHGWGDKYGPILHGLGLNSPDELIDFTDGEVKEVLLEPLQLAGAPALHIARILKALKQHRSSTLTNNVDDLVNPGVNVDPANTTNRVDNLETIENYVEDVTDTTNRVENRETIDDVTNVTSDLDDDVMTAQSCNERELGIRRGSIFDNVALLADTISAYAQKHNFHVRREKHAIVCSNAGHTTWTAVNDFEARAKKKLRHLKKANDANGPLNPEDFHDDWRDLLQCEEDKVRIFDIISPTM
jgi:hypothetical protein